ncbi:MAG: DUF1330 domain-containing protein [Chitinophagales bacterium]
MIFITQLIYIKQGEESAFHQFEKIAIPLIQNYKGKLLLRVRPSVGEIIEGNLEPPYEMHVIEFESEQDFQRFMGDEERKKFLYLKEQSIRSVVLIKGVQLS